MREYSFPRWGHQLQGVMAHRQRVGGSGAWMTGVLNNGVGD